MHKLQSVQVLRAVAILPVVISHYSTFSVGRAGVDLFFCISGFVMAGQMQRSPGQFALDRFTRIYPPFLAALALLFILVRPTFDARRLSLSLILWPNYHAIYLFPGWSLGYEAMFYAACIASMFVGGRVVLFAFAALFLLEVPYAGSAFVLEFLAGFAIARRRWLALPVLLAAAAIDHRVLMFGPPAAFLLWLLTRHEHWFRSSRWEPVGLIGDASYAIYLTHAIVGMVTGLWPLAIMVNLCLAVGLTFHFAAEKPLVRLARMASARVRSAGVAAPPLAHQRART